MNSFIIITAIVILLLFCVTIITIIQKREQEKAAIQQKISQYRYRANQATNILSSISALPIGKETRLILFQYALANLNAIKELAPHDNANIKNIQTFESYIQNPNSKVDTLKLNIPQDLEILKKQINALSNLAKYILQLHKQQNASPSLVPTAINRIMGLIAESKVCAFINQGKSLLEKNEVFLAQQDFAMALQILNKVNNKNERLQLIEQELKALMEANPQPILQTPVENHSTQAENKELVNSEKQSDDLFGPKKKW